MQDYEKRLNIPIQGTSNIEFFTKSNIKVANGYNRIVIGERGPYIEFKKEHINRECLIPSPTQHFYYKEYRINPDNVKVYFQHHYVNYADYIPGYIYISPFDLYVDGKQIILPIK